MSYYARWLPLLPPAPLPRAYSTHSRRRRYTEPDFLSVLLLSPAHLHGPWNSEYYVASFVYGM